MVSSEGLNQPPGQPRAEVARALNQFEKLLEQDCAQQYEAFEFLENALEDPVHFLEFCPAQISMQARHEFIRRYYSLDSKVVREVLRYQGAMSIRVQNTIDRKAQMEIEAIAKAAGARFGMAQRIVQNLQRAKNWIERAASQLVLPGSATNSHNATRTHSFFDSGSSAEVVGREVSADSEMAYPAMAAGFQAVPELEVLGEPLRSRYRSLVFVLLCKFDLWSKTSQTLRAEQIEDVASVLLASGGVVDSGDHRARLIEVLTNIGAEPQPADGPISGSSSRKLARLAGSRAGPPVLSQASGTSTHQSPDRPNRNWSAGILMGGGSGREVRQEPSSNPQPATALDASVREKLNQLDSKILRHKYGDFKNNLLAELSSGDEGITPKSRMDEESGHARTGRSDWSRGWLSRTSRSGKLKTSGLEPFIKALTTGMNSLQTSTDFVHFFVALADFAEKLRQLDSSEPLELFQRCYSAVETLSERDPARSRGSMWPQWLSSWKTFLEFYRACAACVLVYCPPSGQVSPREPVSATTSHGQSGYMESQEERRRGEYWQDWRSTESPSRITSTSSAGSQQLPGAKDWRQTPAPPQPSFLGRRTEGEGAAASSGSAPPRGAYSTEKLRL